MAAPASLIWRARVAARGGSRSMSGPGAVAERMALEMLREAQSSRSAVRVQGGMVQPDGSPLACWMAGRGALVGDHIWCYLYRYQDVPLVYTSG